MPKRTDIQTILILGAGPIVIGQACEFDYAGVQACKALKEEGYTLILVNSNPATIMTDPELAHRTYIEPITPEVVERIIAQEKPQALLPTMGGQTALNCALALSKKGVLAHYGVALIGASESAIEKAEDRALFRVAMANLGLNTTRAKAVYTLDEALSIQPEFGFPVVIRPSFTLGGSGGGIAYHAEEFKTVCERGFELSINHELLLEESIIGWHEFELEVVRDKHDNGIIVCSIENIDPVGVHTGDSMTVAPALTLTDRAYQYLRDASLAILREIGVETGGANVQFAVHPRTGEIRVIEMNPRVSRSSALASKATGFPIAKVAAKLAVGYTLDEIRNDITEGILPMSFEPTLDYVVVKLPRFQFDKFPQADTTLTTQMKSVGEVMAIGENFQQALQKAIVSLETGHAGFTSQIEATTAHAQNLIREHLHRPHPLRLFYLGDAFRLGLSIDEVYHLTAIDPWFLHQIADIVATEQNLPHTLNDLSPAQWQSLKQQGFTDQRLAQCFHLQTAEIRNIRQKKNVFPAFKRVDSCAAEFKASTAYLYSTYLGRCEALPTSQPKVVIIGSGPNRIGQGIEFDYCCVHAAYALKQAGYESIMINCNPETVSTDYDTADRLYFEPLSEESVLDILAIEKPAGVILQLGGQTPLKLAQAIAHAGYTILGTSPEKIALAEDRAQFSRLIAHLHLKQPHGHLFSDLQTGIAVAATLDYPVLVRPSFVLGGQAMQIVHTPQALEHYLVEALNAADNTPVLVDHFLNQAIEVDVDALCDGKDVLITGIMEHIEPAGIHSGDSACSLPPFTLTPAQQQALIHQSKMLALGLGVIGLLNIQFAIQGQDIYVLELNPRASRSMPFVAKATGKPIIQWAIKIMLGCSLQSLYAESSQTPELCQGYLSAPQFNVKLPVFPFIKFTGVDPVLGPEMKSTGEVMGQGSSFGQAYAKAMLAAGIRLPARGTVVLSLAEEDKPALIAFARRLCALGFTLFATYGTGQILAAEGLPHTLINKCHEGRPHLIDLLKNNRVDFIVMTAYHQDVIDASSLIRITALQSGCCAPATFAAALAIVEAMETESTMTFQTIQTLHNI